MVLYRNVRKKYSSTPQEIKEGLHSIETFQTPEKGLEAAYRAAVCRIGPTREASALYVTINPRNVSRGMAMTQDNLNKWMEAKIGLTKEQPKGMNREDYIVTLVKSLNANILKCQSRKNLDIGCLYQTYIPGAIIGDSTRLRQILINLIGNAIKFTKRGEVVVKVERMAAENAHVDLRFSVSDTGIGIPQGKLDTIFDAFAQVDASTTRRFGGTGLGLAISADLVRLMGGQLEVESEVGQGSCRGQTQKQ